MLFFSLLRTLKVNSITLDFISWISYLTFNIPVVEVFIVRMNPDNCSLLVLQSDDWENSSWFTFLIEAAAINLEIIRCSYLYQPSVCLLRKNIKLLFFSMMLKCNYKQNNIMSYSSDFRILQMFEICLVIVTVWLKLCLKNS